jgi:hypothetical protein
MIIPYLKRRWWLTSKRILPTLGFALLLPVILQLFINFPMRKLELMQDPALNPEHWILPGLLCMIVIISLIPNLFRDFFELRVYRNVLTPISIAPISKIQMILGFLITAMIESLVFTLMGILVFWLLMNSQLELYQYAIIIPYILLFAALVGNIIISFSLLTDRTTTFVFLILTAVVIIMFGSELFIDLSLYPQSIGMILRYFPTSQVLHGLRQVIFSGEFNITATAVPLAFTILLTYFNGELLKRKVNQ